MGKRGPKPQLSRDQVLDAAMSLISRQGLDALTMARLARQLNTSGSGLYRYFESKDEIIVGLQERAIGEYAAEVCERLDAAERAVAQRRLSTEVTALYRVIIAFTWYLEHASARPARHRLLDVFVSAPEPLLGDEHARRVSVGLEDALRVCGGTIDDAAEAGALEPGDSVVRTYLLWAALHGLDHFRKRDRIQPEHLQVRSLVISLLRTVLIGFGGRREDVAQALDAYVSAD